MGAAEHPAQERAEAIKPELIEKYWPKKDEQK